MAEARPLCLFGRRRTLAQGALVAAKLRTRKNLTPPHTRPLCAVVCRGRSCTPALEVFDVAADTWVMNLPSRCLRLERGVLLFDSKASAHS